MKRIDIELVGDRVNATVVRLPGRNFPGVVVQGDSLAALARAARRARDALVVRDVLEASEELQELCELLEGYKSEYEDALRAAGLELPYVERDRER